MGENAENKYYRHEQTTTTELHVSDLQLGQTHTECYEFKMVDGHNPSKRQNTRTNSAKQ